MDGIRAAPAHSGAPLARARGAGSFTRPAKALSPGFRRAWNQRRRLVMADVLRRGRRPGAAWVAAPLMAAVLAGCEPGAVGGFSKVVYRDEPEVPTHAFPDPPAVTP